MSRQLTFEQEIAKYEKGKAKSAWFNPTETREKDKRTGLMVEPKTIYIGEVGGAPTWEEPVLDVAAFLNTRKLFREGKIDADKAAFSPYYPAWQDRVNEYYDAIIQRKAAVGTNAAFSAIDVVNVMATMFGLEIRAFVLDRAITVVNTPSLSLEVDIFSRFNASQDVGEGIAAVTKRGSVTRISFDLLKDVGHVALTDEAIMKSVHDLVRAHVENAVTDLKRIKAKKIATELETADDFAGADWAAYTTDHSTTSPYDNIGSVVDTIVSNNGIPNTIASHDKVWRDFIGNTHVKGFSVMALPNTPGAKVITDVPGLPGFTWYVDNEKTPTICTVYDKQAVIMAQGPVRTAQYRLEAEGIDAYIVRDWNQVKRVQSGKIRDITGVTA
jgi:hypothetical protein